MMTTPLYPESSFVGLLPQICCKRAGMTRPLEIAGSQDISTYNNSMRIVLFLAPTVLLLAAPAHTQEEILPKQADASCPNYGYRADTPFGASLDAINTDFAQCTVRVRHHRTGRNDARPDIADWWSTEPMHAEWGLPDFTVWTEPLTEATVRCSCWDTMDAMRLLFRKDQSGATHLMAVEKDFDRLLPDHDFFAQFQQLVDQKAGYPGVAFLVSGYHRTAGHTLFRWLDESDDLMIDIGQVHAKEEIDITSFYLSGSELNQYLAPVMANRAHLDEPQGQSAELPAQEL